MLRNVGLRKSVEQPVLDLNFAASQIGSNGAPDARMNDFNRGSNAWFVDSDGLVKKSPHNFLTNSEDVTVWTVFNTTVSANAAESPTGELTADKVIADSGQTTHIVRRDITGLDDSVDVAVSVYLKQAGFTSVAIQFYDKNSTFHSSGNFDLTDGSRISNATSGTQSSIEHVGNDWYRVTFTGIDTGTGSSNPSIRFGASGTGDGSKGFLIWGAQFSQHSTLPVDNPYLKTEASAVYAARLDHDPSWFMSAAQEQNLLRYSEMLDDSYWTKSAVSVTANAETDPLGGTTAEYVFATSPSGIFPAVVVDFDVAKGVVHTLSFYAKKGERDRIHVDNQNPGPVFNENVISNAELTSEWQRFTGTFTPDENTSRLAFYFGSGAKTWSGDQGFYLWGLQVEVGSTASTYHRTEGAPYYGPGATPKGLLIEEARTNAVTYSEDFSASGLNPGISPANSVTITSNAALAPDGTNTATKLIAASASGSSGHLVFKIVSVDNDTDVVASVFMKYAGNQWGVLELSNTGYISAKRIFVDLQNGVLGASSDSSGTIEDYGNGWYRVSLKNTTDSDGGNDVLAVAIAEDDGDTQFTGDDTNGIFVWGLQQENGVTFPTSYIPTTGSSATRNADVATMGPTTGGTELVTNGTFDTDTTGWDDFTGRSNISVSSGQLVVDVVDAGFGFVARTDVGGGYDPVVVPGRRYRLSADLKVNSGNGVEIDVYGSGSPIAATGVVTSGTLTTKTVDFTCPDGVTSVTLFVDNIAPRATTDEYVIDNVSVRELYPFEQYNPSEGTMYAESESTAEVLNSCVFVITDLPTSGSNNQRLEIRHYGSTTGASRMEVVDGGVAQASITPTQASDFRRNALAYKANSVNAAGDGVSGTEDTSASVPSVDEVLIGGSTFNVDYTGHIKRLSYYPRRLSDEAIENLTSD